MRKHESIKEKQQIINSNANEEIDLDEYNMDIETAMKEMDNGEYTSHDEVRKILIK